MAKKRGRKSQRQYFTEDTELAIVEYLASEDQAERNRIYNSRIHHSFYKLAENLIHTFKFYYTEVDDLEDLKHEVICFLLEKLHYFKVGKGKADLLEADTDDGILTNMENQERLAEKIEFLDIFIEKVDYKIPSIFNKHEDRMVADAVLTLFKKREALEIFNKKALYIYIREITGCDTPSITKVTKALQKYYYKAYSQWELGQPIVL